MHVPMSIIEKGYGKRAAHLPVSKYLIEGRLESCAIAAMLSDGDGNEHACSTTGQLGVLCCDHCAILNHRPVNRSPLNLALPPR